MPSLTAASLFSRRKDERAVERLFDLGSWPATSAAVEPLFLRIEITAAAREEGRSKSEV